MLKRKHQCHSVCSLEIGTCIINEAAHKKERKYTFYVHILKVDINFQRKKKTKKKNKLS